DDEAVGYATFQSHNQKVVWNRRGIFTTHIRTRNEPYTAQTWRLSRSTDGGRTFSTIHEAVDATNPPVLETDDDDNLYLVRPDFQDGNAYLYRFLAEKEFRDPIVTTIPGGSAGKFAMIRDKERGRLYYFAHNNTFHVVGLDGEIRGKSQLIRAGTNAVLQYPLLSMDSDGTLHAAWTTQKHGQYLYWDIHHMLSPDGGASWRNLSGEALSPPVTADDTGPALRITLDDEFEVHTWLSSFVVKEGKVHCLYMAQTDPPRQHYMRFDVATGERDVHVEPEFRGESIRLQGLGGFFAASSGRAGSPLYCVMADGGHLACLVSRDNGETWHDFAKSEETFHIYSPGGCRELTGDGSILGTFTDQHGSNLTPDRKSKVYFFKINTVGQRAPQTQER
ncbi:MAG: BNR-4 repeat-containing protein, partial [Planctomycetota bacterium]